VAAGAGRHHDEVARHDRPPRIIWRFWLRHGRIAPFTSLRDMSLRRNRPRPHSACGRAAPVLRTIAPLMRGLHA